VKQGDLIVGAGDVDTPDADTLYEVLDAAGPALVLHVVRGADELDLEVQFPN
jgi:hypothetical protein